ncbi:hypothetical protein [Buttiauxella noackiae]|uniref:hypothetical protein n=1 Tax=Buttiauxella noackiae TaxID=82992 RepID=UPI0028D44164|nr:hypothetical protein [Buttiauxella noackiae]
MNIPIIVTSCINPNAPLTKLQDPKIRIDVTIDALKKICKHADNIVFCDGSAFDISAELKKHPEFDNKNIEVLFFKNDTKSVEMFGKGFGEGEIVNYAVEHSEYIHSSTCFAKLTSKLYVDNLQKCLKAFNSTGFFVPVPSFREEMIDTRFYIVDKNFYNKNLKKVYKKVRDLEGIYLEHVFYDVLIKLDKHKYVARVMPIIRGVSGTFNTNYSSDNKMKYFIKTLRLKYLSIFSNSKEK